MVVRGEEGVRGQEEVGPNLGATQEAPGRRRSQGQEGPSGPSGASPSAGPSRRREGEGGGYLTLKVAPGPHTCTTVQLLTI